MTTSIFEAVKIIQESPENAIGMLDDLYKLSIHPTYYANLVKKYPNAITSLVKTEADLIKFLNCDPDFPISLLKPVINLSVDNQKIFIKWDSYNFTVGIIDSWTPELMDFAIKKNPELIKIIPNPPVEIQETVVSRQPWLIKFIKNPSPSVQIIYIQKQKDTYKNSPYIRDNLPKIHPEVQLWVVDNHPRLAYIWPELIVEAQMKLVEKHPDWLPITNHTHYQAFVIAAHKVPNVLIQKLPGHLENSFVDEYPHMIDLIKKPNNRTKSIICKRNGNWIGGWWYKLKN